MTLSWKLFLSFFSLIACLLGFTLYITRVQTEAHEITRIQQALMVVQQDFQGRLDSHQKETLKLVRTITLEQKFRAFLSQIKDNYYPFAEEIALDSSADMVFMVDEASRMRATYPMTPDSHEWFRKHVQELRTAEVLDTGAASFHITPLGNEFLSMVYVPLKESLSDEYAIGVIVVCKRMDDAWIKVLFGQTLDSYGIRAVFFIGDTPVAGNVSTQEGSAMLGALHDAEPDLGSYLFAGERYIARAELFDDSGTGPAAGYVLSSNLDQALKPFQSLQNAILLIGFITLLVGMVVTLGLANRFVRPLRVLVGAAKEVAKGNFDVRVQARSRDEMGELSDAFNHMTEGLHERERIRGSLSKYEQQVHEQVAEIERMGRLKRFFSPELAEVIVSGGAEDLLASHRREITVVFLDLRGFTAFAENAEPEQVMQILEEYHGEMGQLIVEYNATLERFTGDGMMLFFNDPVPMPKPDEQAVRMALAMQERVAMKLQEAWSKAGHDLGFSIGIAAGFATLGMIGFEGRRDYAAIGSVANLAARLCGEARASQILVSQHFLHRVEDTVEAEFVGEVNLKGFHHSISTYAILRMRG